MKKIIVVLFIVLMLSVPLFALAEGLGNSIIIYFDYSENIVTDGLDVDAVSSASVAEGPGVREIGNLLVMVDQIEQRSGATIHPLRITEKYAPMYMDMVDGALEDKENDRQFTFEEPLPDLSDVDTVFFGSPIWWYDMPQPVVNFFQQVDLSGKRFMYFSINRGSGNSSVIERLKELQPGLTVAAEYSLDAMQDNESAASEFNAWL
ncbi:MAG: NAD(P)H-dependent oxidoreductase, partial [Clostridia bacterium]|nr:NAD(P)H-dependent oxidoreductase [Clostridia bacterium]